LKRWIRVNNQALAPGLFTLDELDDLVTRINSCLVVQTKDSGVEILHLSIFLVVTGLLFGGKILKSGLLCCFYKKFCLEI
jgi:hypothetical protein